MRRSRRVFAVAGMVAAGAAALLGLLLASGQLGFVTTHGVSMNPVYYQGDLVVVARAPSYRVGEIAAYRMPGKQLTVLHRIIGGSPDGFMFKGDNNQSTDLTHPTAAQLVGHAVLHLPHAGAWLGIATSPAAIGVAAFLVIAAGGAAAHTRYRHGIRKAEMSPRQHSNPAPSKQRLPPAAKAAAWAATDLAVVGLLLGAAAWSGPAWTSTTSTAPAPGRVEFGYSAAVGHSPAYDGVVVRSPDPVFRRRTDTVTVRYGYWGPAARVATNVELSTASGWHSTLPLAAAGPLAGNGQAGELDLHLSALAGRASAAATATGMPVGAVTVAVTAAVQPSTGPVFRAALTLDLTPLQLSLPGGVASLTVHDPSTTTQTGRRPRTLGLFGRHVGIVAARGLSLVLIVTALLVLTWFTRLMRRVRRENEQTAIGLRYPQLVVPIESAPPAVPGRPVIDVPNFVTLARLAEHYDLLILQSHASEGETFQMAFAGTTYRYRALRGANPRTRASDLFGPQPERRGARQPDGQQATAGADRRTAEPVAPPPRPWRRRLGGLTAPFTAVRRGST